MSSPPTRASAPGALLITSSVAGFQPLPGNATYAASLPGLMFRSPEYVAEAGLAGLERGRRVVVPGAPNRIGAALGRFSPRPVLLRIMDRP
jgi:short-subunit dehydrogenase